MGEELKPILEKLEALQTEVDQVKQENATLKESIQKVTDLNRTLLNSKGSPQVTSTDEAKKKFEQYMKGE